jgi:AcrR family transcriptional regulator
MYTKYTLAGQKEFCQELSGQKRSPNRPYRMVKRNESVAETRQRIVEAAVELHGTIGPAATSIAAVAEAAGVTRLTVYRHFPDADSLFAACSAHWMSQQDPPRPELWAQVDDPLDRVRTALTDLYRFYRDGEAMLSRTQRDWDQMPPGLREDFEAQTEQMRELLVSVFRVRGTHRRRLAAVVGHAIAFATWRSLCIEQGLKQAEAVDLMVTLAESNATGRRTPG